MMPISISKNDPQAFLLASDAVYTTGDQEIDQVWSLQLGPHTFAPFFLHTTYQLRVKSMRLFPNIVIHRMRLTKPEVFFQFPKVTEYAPGIIRVEYYLINGLDVKFTCFAKTSDSLIGSILIKNKGKIPVSFLSELCAHLVPTSKGHPMQPERIKGYNVLKGHSDDLYPVLWMSAGPEAVRNPNPALSIPVSLKPAQTTELFWALASKGSTQASINYASRSTGPALRKLYQAQLKTYDRQTLQVKTGNPHWDIAFYLAQVNGCTHSINPRQDSHTPIFSKKRLPDESSFSPPTAELTTNLSLLDALHLSQIILPMQVKHFSALLKGFINRVNDMGIINLKDIGDSDIWARNQPPVLAYLCLKHYEVTQEKKFLRESLPALQRFFDKGWMPHEDLHNNFPVWHSPNHLQLNSGLFSFDSLHDFGKGLNIRTAKSPSLVAMLYQEARSLQTIAEVLEEPLAEQHYEKISAELQDELHQLWNDERSFFNYRDCQSLGSPKLEFSLSGQIQENLIINQSFTEPQRLQIHLDLSIECSRNCLINVDGQDEKGQKISEIYSSSNFSWGTGKTHLTTKNLFSRLNVVSFRGFDRVGQYLIETANYHQEDISCLLPLWSACIGPEQIQELVQKHINWEDASLSFGIPETWEGNYPIPDEINSQINILWNTLIIEGLIKTGFTEKAAEGFSNLMKTIIRMLKNFHGFYSAFDLQKGYPLGYANAITGLAPLNLCLKIAGIKIFNPKKIALWGTNPFAWPIEVRWQGLWIWKEGNRTKIIFPDGSHYEGTDTKPQVIYSG